MHSTVYGIFCYKLYYNPYIIKWRFLYLFLYDAMTILKMTSLVLALLIYIDSGGITYNDITYK